jgi:hypothetical protein
MSDAETLVQVENYNNESGDHVEKLRRPRLSAAHA